MRVRVVTVNWNGFEFTDACLRSLADAGFDRGELDVVVIDNASVDGSLERLRQRHPDVTFVANSENLGFAEACNQGMRDRRGIDAIALVNNDATVEPGWLEALCDGLVVAPDIGAVAAMLVLDPPFVEVGVNADGPVSLSAVRVDGEDVTNRCVVRGGSRFGDPSWPLDTVAVLDGSCLVFAPAPIGSATIQLDFMPAPTPGVDSAELPAISIERAVTTRTADRSARVTLSAGSDRVELVNGLGTDRTDWGEAFDIGFGERLTSIIDNGPRDVPGFCGGGVLLRTSALDEVGLFDPRFFAYYEDTDLSRRMAGAGWRIVTAPTAIIRHHFGGSGGARAPWFFFLNYRNWMLTTLRNGDRVERRRALRQLREWLRTAVRTNVGSRLKHGRMPSLRLIRAWIGVLLAVVATLPRLDRSSGGSIGAEHTTRVRSRLQPR